MMSCKSACSQPAADGTEQGQVAVCKSPIYYDTQIALCARRNDAEGADAWLCHMRENGVQPTESCINAVIGAYAANEDLSSAEKMFHSMVEKDVRPTGPSYMVLINSLLRAGDRCAAEQWMQKMRQEGYELPEQVCGSIIQARSKAVDLSSAEASLQHLLDESSTTRPSIVMFNNVIHACSLASKPHRASHWFDELVRRGLTPNEHTFGALLNAWAESGDVDQIEHYTKVMADFGLSGTNVSFNTLLKACAHQGDIERAEVLFEQMRAEGHELSLITFNTMIHTCTQAGDLNRAEHYLRMVEASELEPNIITYNTVINACAAQGDAARAEQWLLHVTKSCSNLTPNEITYGTICKAFARQGNVNAVERVMQNFESDGFTLNVYFFASLISACGSCQPPDTVRAEKAFRNMVSRGLRAQSVKRVLSRALGEKRANQLVAQATKETMCNERTGAGEEWDWEPAHVSESLEGASSWSSWKHTGPSHSSWHSNRCGRWYGNWQRRGEPKYSYEAKTTLGMHSRCTSTSSSDSAASAFIKPPPGLEQEASSHWETQPKHRRSGKTDSWYHYGQSYSTFYGGA